MPERAQPGDVSSQESDPVRVEALCRERRAQLRGLLLIALATLVFLLVRARPLHLFHADWWRP